MSQKAVFEALRVPFPEEVIDVKVQTVARDGRRGQVVAYVDARAVMNRLDEVAGAEGWYDTYEVLADRLVPGRNGEERLVEVKCRLTVLGVTKEDVGEGDTLKAAFSDALKRAAVKFGVGRHLYEMEKVWVELDERGQFDREAAKAALLGRRSTGKVPNQTPKPATEAQIRFLRRLGYPEEKMVGLTASEASQLIDELTGSAGR
ncbi:Rad52/Rad22 family DNA repair protein [Thermus caldifontis]|uniref:Rad52/Rad22 family DNA repair protein n=1 Tax=Thermus caldifontis TaxID=1930763 RepID=UPI000DF2D8DB|nr:Rad52/Rad22 family DNA repair protein [Thermus caldifontis]